eukprot:GHUV01053079.1.p1 GENE.GHUV01053079.1~~GHUV01053079.1.p1  ORF type:complete len:155 (+),score=46.07 GHUV01053079.1:96-560(+)
MQSQPAHQSKLDDVAEGLPLCSALQYLPSALRDTGKRQLDCLGIATAVLALCQQISQHHQQHADLASSSMMVSDDHCWLSVSGAPGGPEVQVEVTDPRWAHARAGSSCSSSCSITPSITVIQIICLGCWGKCLPPVVVLYTACVSKPVAAPSLQ